MNTLTIFGVASVSAMLVFYALEDRGRCQAVARTMAGSSSRGFATLAGSSVAALSFITEEFARDGL